jgi:hypothetical protein
LRTDVDKVVAQQATVDKNLSKFYKEMNDLLDQVGEVQLAADAVFSDSLDFL